MIGYEILTIEYPKYLIKKKDAAPKNGYHVNDQPICSSTLRRSLRTSNKSIYRNTRKGYSNFLHQL